LNFYNEIKKYKVIEGTKLNAGYDILNEIDGAMVIKCDNVVSYYFNNGGFEEYRNLQSFINLYPPFEKYFVEMESEFVKLGFLNIPYMDNNITIVYSHAFVLFPKESPDYIGTFRYSTDDMGKPIDKDLFVIWNDSYFKQFINKTDVEISKNAYGNNYYASLLAVQFMHCKNVVRKEIDPNKNLPRRVQKHWEKKGRAPLTKYYTLQIEPLKKILKYEGNIERNGLKKALHICRGHFKDFTEGKGLFGKYHGLYYWDSQVRGNKEYGEIIKDYNVNIPESGDA
jgi:hypothetical protein